MPARPRRRASVARSSPYTARVLPFVATTSTSPGAASARALITGRWSSSATTVNAGPATRTSGSIVRTAGSTTGRVLSASESAETSMASSRSIRSTAQTVSHAQRVEPLQQLVRDELDLLVAPLGCAVVAGDQAHAMDPAEVAVDERVAGLRLVGGALGEPEGPLRVLLP